jgi:hypothetical protein
MLGSPSSRAPAQDRDRRERDPVISESGEEHPSGLRHVGADKVEAALPRDSSRLPQQVIYHFAVGRAIADPRLDA